MARVAIVDEFGRVEVVSREGRGLGGVSCYPTFLNIARGEDLEMELTGFRGGNIVGG